MDNATDVRVSITIERYEELLKSELSIKILKGHIDHRMIKGTNLFYGSEILYAIGEYELAEDAEKKE